MAVVPDRWANPRQTRHHLLTALSEYFHIVWYGPVPEWRRVVRDHRFAPWYRAERRLGGLVEYTPSSLFPKVYRPHFASELFERIRLTQARYAIRPIKIRKWVLYLWHPDYVSTLDHARYDISCYHIDDEYSFLPDDPPNDPVEIGIIKRVNQVFIHSNNLMIKKGYLNQSSIRVPNGVDFGAYATPREEPEDMRDIPHPRMGYIGYIKSHMDLNMHLELARAKPEWQYVFVGPIGAVGDQMSVVNALFSLPNVHYMGPKAVDDLPAYCQHFDVCLMGYKRNNYTKYIYPLKMHEYLATGLPVVSSPIPAAMEFSNVLTIADGVDGWIEALEFAQRPEMREPNLVAQRRETARAYDWHTLAATVAEAMCRNLGPEYVSRFADTQEALSQRSVIDLLSA